MEEAVKKTFDLQVTYRDDVTGLVTYSNPYTMRAIKAQDGGTMRIFERPVGSGNIWNKKGEPAGRWEVDAASKKGMYVPGAEHVAFVAPETKDQKLARSLTEKDVQIAALQKELAMIKADGGAEVKQPKVETKKKQGS